MKKIIIIIFVLIFVSSVYALCNSPESEYSTPCGHGEEDCHGVELEGLCYDCGAADGICPEDFFDPALGWSCEGLDIDCVDGIVCVDCSECSSWGAGCTYDECVSCTEGCFFDPVWNPLVEDCRPCSGIISECSDYDNIITCDSDDCDISGCAWEGDPGDGVCITAFEGDCADISDCSDYTSYGEDSCNYDLCDVYYDYSEDHTFVEGNIVCFWNLDNDDECKDVYLCDIGEEYLVPTSDAGECDLLKDISVDCDCDDCDCADKIYPPGCEEVCDSCCAAADYWDISYEEPAQEFPIFTGFNLIITCLILIGFYVFIHKKK